MQRDLDASMEQIQRDFVQRDYVQGDYSPEAWRVLGLAGMDEEERDDVLAQEPGEETDDSDINHCFGSIPWAPRCPRHHTWCRPRSMV